MPDRMTPATRLHIAVEVHIGDTWWPGELYHWRRDGDRWTAYVRYSVGPGLNHVRWVDQGDVREV